MLVLIVARNKSFFGVFFLFGCFCGEKKSMPDKESSPLEAIVTCPTPKGWTKHKFKKEETKKEKKTQTTNNNQRNKKKNEAIFFYFGEP